MRILISLVSEQTLPNVLFIRQMEKYDFYVFVTTSRMDIEEKANAIIEVAQIDNHLKLVVEPDNIEQIFGKLSELNFSQVDELHLHITGGTKLMALTAYSFFTSRYNNVRVFYIPIHKSIIQQVFPDQTEIPLVSHVNLPEYLTSHGIMIYNEDRDFDDQRKYASASKFIGEIASGQVPHEIQGVIRGNGSGNSRVFLGGGWFELWAAVRIKELLGLKSDEISMNMKLAKSRSKPSDFTEYDVVFVRDNRLFIAECKYFSSGKFSMQKVRADWYKLAGLQLQMGLYATPFFLTANRLQNSQKEYFESTKSIFRIKGVADINIVGTKDAFSSFLNQL